MNLSLGVTVSFNLLPATVTIRSFGGKLICVRKINSSFTLFRLCLTERNIIVTVTPFNVGSSPVSRFLRLGCTPKCYRLNLFFGGNAITPVQTMVFSLTDANYKVPIDSAILNFNKN